MIYFVVIMKMLFSAGLTLVSIRHDNWLLAIICLVIFADCGVTVTTTKKPSKDNI